MTCTLLLPLTPAPAIAGQGVPEHCWSRGELQWDKGKALVPAHRTGQLVRPPGQALCRPMLPSLCWGQHGAGSNTALGPVCTFAKEALYIRVCP